MGVGQKVRIAQAELTQLQAFRLRLLVNCCDGSVRLVNSQLPDKQKAHLDGGVHLVDDALNEMKRQRLHKQELNAIHGQLRALRYGLQWDCPALRGQPARCMSSMEFTLQKMHESHRAVHGISVHGISCYIT